MPYLSGLSADLSVLAGLTIRDGYICIRNLSHSSAPYTGSLKSCFDSKKVNIECIKRKFVNYTNLGRQKGDIISSFEFFI